MPIDPDATPEAGIQAIPLEALPDEPPTQPDLRVVTCPACKGHGQRLVSLETHDDGSLHRLRSEVCDWCGGAKKVDRMRHAQWHEEALERLDDEPTPDGETRC